ncbi:hypothetical protein CK203_019135 [Vitis vinifera]|uniref:DUF4283 domain-containing protein n=1 Tax=Vitis vinifera TaxID=29760 RepID=A0A438J7K2_VITVI|nr:hypothetical protein CK203_019135 [Vitis vinifera]
MVRTLKVYVERKTFLVRLEGEPGGKWCSITKHSKGFVFVLGLKMISVDLMEVCFNKPRKVIRISKFASNKKSTFLVIPEGEKDKGWENLKIGRWTRVVVCECTADCVNWVEDLSLLKIKGGYRVQLRRWSPKENSEVKGKFKGGWIELQGLPFHYGLSTLKKIVERWGTVTKFDWRTLKLFDLNKAMVRISMKERLVFPTLIKVMDEGWVFTIYVVVVGAKEVKRGGEMVSRLGRFLATHSGTGGRKRVKRDRSTTDRSSCVRPTSRKKNEEKGKRLKHFPWGHLAREDRLWGTAGSSLPRSLF